MEKRDQIIANLKRLNGAAIGSIDSVTNVKLTGGKKNPHLNRVTKQVKNANVIIFCNISSNGYKNMIERRLVKEGKEGNFELSQRAWGERVPNTPFVLHKGKLYLETIYLKSPKNVTYFLDGVEIDKSEIIGFPTKQEGDQGGLENKVIIRTYDLENITQIKMGELSVA